MTAERVTGQVGHCAQGSAGGPDALSFRTAVDAMIASSSYGIAVLLCVEAHNNGTFTHYQLPQASGHDQPRQPLPGEEQTARRCI